MIVEHIKALDLYDPYIPEGDEKHISVTSLLKPAYQVWKKPKTDENDLVETNKDAAILGSLIHYALEHLVSKKISKHYEERISVSFMGWIINGQFDLVVDEHVSDYKTGNVLKLNDITDYIWQLSIYRWLIFKKYGVTLKETGLLMFILKDFSVLKLDSRLYRTHGVESMFHEVEVKLHSFDEVEEFIRLVLSQIDGDEMPEKCDTWYNDMRCQHFCELRNACDYRSEALKSLTNW